MTEYPGPAHRRRESGWDIRLTTQPQVIPRLRINGTMPPFSHVTSWHAQEQLHNQQLRPYRVGTPTVTMKNGDSVTQERG